MEHQILIFLFLINANLDINASNQFWRLYGRICPKSKNNFFST